MDDKMLSVLPQAGKDNRVFIGIVVICGVHKYCIPLSSPKEKYKNMKKSMDFSKIEVNGKLLGVLNFNLMIPIEKEQLQLVDTTIFKRDRENIRYYKKLCTLELEWCQTNNEDICNKANVLYKKYIPNELFAGRNRCLNFPQLEAECEKYNLKIKRGTNCPFICLHYHNSSESSASIHICIFLSRYSLAYSSSSSIVKAFKAHSEQGVIFKPFSALLQSIRKK
jgi:protein AbiQ